jgi:hypothetical protein
MDTNSNVPTGYVLMPKKPTEEIIKAGIKACNWQQHIGAKEVICIAYAAMLQAYKDR